MNNKGNEKIIFNKKLNNNMKFNIPSFHKIPKGIKVSQNISLQNTNTNIPLLNAKKPSLLSIKNSKTKNSSRKTLPVIKFPMINQSLTNFRNKCHKRNSKEKCLKSDNVNKFTSEALLKDESMNLANIEYFRLKEDIETFLEDKEDKNNIEFNISQLKEFISKVDKILILTNAAKIDRNEKGNEENIKSLNLCIEKYNKLNERLNEIKNDDFIDKINNKINDINKEINFFEKDNKNYKNNDNNINNTNNANQIWTNNGINQNLDDKILNKINEYENLISEEMLISKQIITNDIKSKKYDSYIKDLQEKYDLLSNNLYGDKINIESNKEELINNCCLKTNHENKISETNIVDMDVEKKKNELIIPNNNKRISKLKKTKNLIPLGDNFKHKIEKDLKLEQYLRFDYNNIIIPNPNYTIKKNFSSANVTSNNNNSKNKFLKELVLKNLDLKEKEQKTFINMDDNVTYSNKYKHIQLKPNFSFNYGNRKNESQNKPTNLDISNNNNIAYNNSQQISESINTEEENNNYNNFLNDINFKKKTKQNELIGRNKICNNEEEKNNHFATEQREKVLNTILYNDINEHGIN